MKRKSVYTCLVMLLMSLALQAKDKDVAVAEALLKRLLPSYIESFQFQKLKGEKDCFTIESVKDKIVIGGNNANSRFLLQCLVGCGVERFPDGAFHIGKVCCVPYGLRLHAGCHKQDGKHPLGCCFQFHVFLF